MASRLGSAKSRMQSTGSTMDIPRNSPVSDSVRNDADSEAAEQRRRPECVRRAVHVAGHAFEDCDGELRQTQADLEETIDLECVLDLVGPARIDSDHNSTFDVSESRFP